MSAKIHADNVFVCLVTLTFDLSTLGFARLMVEHFCIKFGDPSCIGFRDIAQKKQTNTQNGGKNHTLATAIGVGDK